MIDDKLLELGTVAILFLIAIKEFFSYLKARKDVINTNSDSNNGSNGAATILSKAILGELQTMNSNHLHTIQKCVEDGNRNLIETIHSDNTKMIELLGEIKGVLSTRK